MDVSMYIKKLLKESGRTQKEAAEVLGYSEQVFRNKLSKRSFTLKQFLTMADAFGWVIRVEVPIVKKKVITTYDIVGTKDVLLIGEES